MNFNQYLQDPQLVNSYSYARDNPLKHIDKSGEFVFLAPLAAYAVSIAPVWLPAVVTTGAAIGAALQTKFVGESIGHFIEGNQQGFEEAVQKQQTVIGVGAALGVGLLGTMSTQKDIKQGGAHGDLRSVEGQVRHHIPAKSVSPYSSNRSPALLMDKEDHWATKSWGSGRAAQTYRATQQTLIKQGRFDEAQQMDINDIRSQFGNKYDQGLKQATQYTKNVLNKK